MIMDKNKKEEMKNWLETNISETDEQRIIREKKVNDNPDSVAFSIFPSEITDVIKVADNNLTMPPKSTWFDPKPLDGLVVYEFE